MVILKVDDCRIKFPYPKGSESRIAIRQMILMKLIGLTVQEGPIVYGKITSKDLPAGGTVEQEAGTYRLPFPHHRPEKMNRWNLSRLEENPMANTLRWI